MKKEKTMWIYLRIVLGIMVFGVGLALLCGDNKYADTYKWDDWISIIFNTIVFLAFGLYLLDIEY
jgi:lipopolysaccharide export LptBFGC system permease protein LptF